MRFPSPRNILHPTLENNLFKISLMVWLSRTFLYVPIFVVYLQSNGLSLAQVMTIKVVIALTVLVLEIPSGYLADRLGRKICLIAAGIIISFGLCVYGLGSSMSVFIVAEILIGTGWSLVSGTESALVYDSLVASGDTAKYLRVESRLTAFGGYAEALGGLLVTFLTLIALEAPFFAQALFLLLYSLLAFTLVEPQHEKEQDQKASWGELFSAIQFVLLKHRVLRWLTIFEAIVSTAGFALVWLCQPYMTQAGLAVEYFGIAWVLFHLVLGVSSQLAYRIESLLGMQKVLILGGFLISGAYFFMSLFDYTIFGICFIAFSYISRGIRGPVIRSYLNENIDSTLRATMLSTSQFVKGFSFIVMGPVFGWLVDTMAIDKAFFLISVGNLLLTLIAFFALRNALLEK